MFGTGRCSLGTKYGSRHAIHTCFLRIPGILEAWICFTFIRYTSENLHGFKIHWLKVYRIQKCKSPNRSFRTHEWFTWKVKKGHALRDAHLEHNVPSLRSQTPHQEHPQAVLQKGTPNVTAASPCEFLGWLLSCSLLYIKDVECSKLTMCQMNSNSTQKEVLVYKMGGEAF